MSSEATSRSRPTRGRIILNQSYAAQADLDWLSWAVGISTSALLRVDFNVAKLELWGQVAILPIVLLCQLVAGGVTGLYRGRWQRGSFEEVGAIARAVLLAGAGLFVIVLVASDPRMVPLSAIAGGGVIAFVLMCGFRYWFRLRAERAQRPAGEQIERVLVVGAGEGGRQLISSMLRDPAGRYLPVALVDDDPDKQSLQVRGVPVAGTTADVADVIDRVDPATVLIAIPSASREVIARVTAGANERGKVVKLLPTVLDLIEGNVSVRDIRTLEPADLLGRPPIHTDVDSIAAYLTDKRVLVTGAGGSIGSELCRQIYGFAPASLVMLDRDESALHAVQLSIWGSALLDSRDIALCDIRDEEALRRVFREHRPDVIFHAAALKHLPVLELYPDEGIKTNVLGTLNVLRLASEFEVERLVNVSTDKAADPVSVLGYTKRIAERLTAAVGASSAGVMLSVRFGNVLGSRGSMLDTFTRQIAVGGPVTVTHPDVTRFFMTIAEACELVIQAGAVGGRGEVLVLDMGRPVRIIDVARQLIAQAGANVEIVITGLRPGEKLNEVLSGSSESGAPSPHPSITRIVVPPLDPAGVEGLCDDGDDHALLAEVALSPPVPPTSEVPSRE